MDRNDRSQKLRTFRDVWLHVQDQHRSFIEQIRDEGGWEHWLLARFAYWFLLILAYQLTSKVNPRAGYFEDRE